MGIRNKQHESWIREIDVRRGSDEVIGKDGLESSSKESLPPTRAHFDTLGLFGWGQLP